MTEGKKVSQRELVREISRETSLRTEVVEEVLAALTNISVEKIVNNEKYSFLNLFSITTYELDFKVPETELTGDKAGKRYKKTALRGKLSKNLRDLYKLQNEEFADSPYLINRDSWKDALKWLGEGGKKRLVKQVDYKSKPVENDEVTNPLLEDDEDF